MRPGGGAHETDHAHTLSAIASRIARSSGAAALLDLQEEEVQ